MIRRLLSILPPLSLAVCIATSVLWVRSYWRSDAIFLFHTPAAADTGYATIVYSGRGSMFFRIESSRPFNQSLPPERRQWDIFYRWEDDPGSCAENELCNGRQWSRLGFGILHDWGTRYAWRQILEISTTRETSTSRRVATARPAPMTRKVATEVILWAYALWFPHWLVVLLSAVPPLRWGLRTRQRRHRARVGLCLHCGYDLRASTERCPECGKPVPAGHISKVPHDPPK